MFAEKVLELMQNGYEVRIAAESPFIELGRIKLTLSQTMYGVEYHTHRIFDYRDVPTTALTFENILTNILCAAKDDLDDYVRRGYYI